METQEITMDEQLLTTLRNNAGRSPEKYISLTVDHYRIDRGIRDAQLLFFSSILRDSGKISKDEYLKIEDLLSQKSDN